uniref:DUF569 domain-containing protein n=1 Tax=Oryza sativa subsp. japonica TaxID=39947 RepID=Q6YYN0_ORYSJ|nr:hypothetical protein [Oryza sativa Japonica Group]
MDVSASRATDRDAGDDIAPIHGTGSPTHGGDTHPPARATEHDDACASDDFHISGQDSTTVDGGDSHSQYAARAPDDVSSFITDTPTDGGVSPADMESLRGQGHFTIQNHTASGAFPQTPRGRRKRCSVLHWTKPCDGVPPRRRRRGRSTGAGLDAELHQRVEAAEIGGAARAECVPNGRQEHRGLLHAPGSGWGPARLHQRAISPAGQPPPRAPGRGGRAGRPSASPVAAAALVPPHSRLRPCGLLSPPSLRGHDHGVLVLLHPRAAAVDGCNSYLHADENGRSVYHGNLRGGGGASLHNAVWAVEEVVAGGHPTRYVLLRGAYGRYLGTARPRRAGSGRCHHVARGPDIAGGCVVLLHDKSGRYLCGNQTFLARRPGVSVDGDVDNETTLRWEVVRVTPSQGRPELPIATEKS